MIYVVIILLVVVGTFFIIKPNTVWKYNHFFTVENGEPTDLYIIFVRISGIILVILALILLGVILFY